MNRVGRMGGKAQAGPIGNCVCPNCGYTTTHSRGVPCFNKKCPECGATMTR